MPTLTGIILGANGSAFTGRVRLEKQGSAAIVAGSLQGGGILVSTAAALTSPGLTIAAGVWLLTWWEGAIANRATLSISAGAGTITLAEVVTSGNFATYQAVYDDPDAVRDVVLGASIQLIFLRQDEQEPPNADVWFVRDPGAGDDDGVGAIHDASGARFRRASL